MPVFTSIFRFRDESGGIFYGEAGESALHTKENLTGRLVFIFRGDTPWDEDFVLTGEQRKVVEVCVSFSHFSGPSDS